MDCSCSCPQCCYLGRSDQEHPDTLPSDSSMERSGNLNTGNPPLLLGVLPEWSFGHLNDWRSSLGPVAQGMITKKLGPFQCSLSLHLDQAWVSGQICPSRQDPLECPWAIPGLVLMTTASVSSHGFFPFGLWCVSGNCWQSFALTDSVMYLCNDYRLK